MTSSFSHPASAIPVNHPMRPEREGIEQAIAQVLVRDMEIFLHLGQQRGQRGFALVNVLQSGDTGGDEADAGAIADWVQRYGLDAEKLLLHTPEASLRNIGPWLIELPGSSAGRADVAELLSDLALDAGVLQGLSLLASPLQAPHLAAHLRSWLHGNILPDPDIEGDDAMGALLRWFDPRVGFGMVSLWPEQERLQFLQAFTWCGWDIDFEPIGYRCSAGRTPQRADRVGRLPLDKALLIAMAGLNPGDDLLADVFEEAEPRAFAAVAPSLQRWIAAHQDAAAAALGSNDRESRVTLLRHALTVHPGLSGVPGFKEHLSRETSSGRGLAHVLAAQTPAWWLAQQEVAPAVWTQWASQFLDPVLDRASLAPALHPYATLWPSSESQLR